MNLFDVETKISSHIITELFVVVFCRFAVFSKLAVVSFDRSFFFFII